MGTPTVCMVLVITVGLVIIISGPSMTQAEGTSQHDTTNVAENGAQCSPLQRRQDLLDARLTKRDSDLNSRLNGVDARLNRMDTRFDDLETMMSDMKAYLQQGMEAMEKKVEWALANTKQAVTCTTDLENRQGEEAQVNRTEGTSNRDNQPARTNQRPKDCQEAYTMGHTSSGVYTIAPEPNTTIDVYCEQGLNGGGWIVFQVRKDGTVEFYQDWNGYKQGFGDLTGEFWLGNNNIHLLTKHHDQQLKVELRSPADEVRYADYHRFWISDETDNFRLHVSGYSGSTPPGDSLGYMSGGLFSTKDRDNDEITSRSLARVCETGWWSKDNAYSNLNGQYKGTSLKGLWWWYWKHHTSMKGTRMMLRKKP